MKYNATIISYCNNNYDYNVFTMSELIVNTTRILLRDEKQIFRISLGELIY